MKKRTRYTVPTLTLEYLIQGTKAFSEALEAGTTTWPTVKNCLKKLEKVNPKAAKEAASWVAENEPEKPAGKGRTAPQSGETRTYSVQQLNKAGGRFIRLPVDLLSTKKGDAVVVEYHDNKIVIKAGEKLPAETEESQEETTAGSLLDGFDEKPATARTMRRKRKTA